MDDDPTRGAGLARRIMTSPGVLTVAVLMVIALVAERSLLGNGPLGGGALVPAWGGASGLWQEYLAGFHTAGVGSAAPAPPYVALLAAVATVLGGKPWLAVDVLLLGSVPLAGLTAYLAARRITSYVPARVWTAAVYALLPAATGAVAAGRIGTAVTAVLIPVIGVLAFQLLTRPGRRGRRAAWAAGLTVAAAAAFVPLLWALAAIAAFVVALVVRVLRLAGRETVINLAIVAVVPAALLFPWTLQLFAHPSLFLVEAGIEGPGLSGLPLPGSALLLLSPGGPGVPPIWVTAGLGSAGLAALLLRRHRVLVTAGWAVALSGLLFAVVVSRISVVPPGAGQAVYGWPGVPLTLAAAGLLLAAAAASESMPVLLRPGTPDARSSGRRERSIRGAPGIRGLPDVRGLPGLPGLPGVRGFPSVLSLRGRRGVPGVRGLPGGRGLRGSGTVPGARAMPGARRVHRVRHIGYPGSGGLAWRSAGTALVAVAACSAPVVAAGSWIARGAAGPVTRADGSVLPALVSASAGSGAPPGTLVLRPGPQRLTYSLLHGTDPLPGEPQIPEPAGAQRKLDRLVAGLVSGSGGDVGADGGALASFGVRYVLLPAPVEQRLSRVLDGTPGLRQLSHSSAFGLWKVTGVTARVRVVEPGGAVVGLPSGSINVNGASAPAAGGTLLLAEPADAGWHASLNGQPLAPLPEPAGGWAQGFQLPRGGGRLDITRDTTGRGLSLLAEGLALLVVMGFALPGLSAAEHDSPGGPGSTDGTPAPRSHAHRRRRTHSARRARGTRGNGATPGRRRSDPLPVPVTGSWGRGTEGGPPPGTADTATTDAALVASAPAPPSPDRAAPDPVPDPTAPDPDAADRVVPEPAAGDGALPDSAAPDLPVPDPADPDPPSDQTALDPAAPEAAEGDWTVPDPAVPEPTAPNPTALNPVPADPAVPDPEAADWAVHEPPAPELPAPELAAPDPAVPEPTVPEPTVPDLAAPDPAVPEPSVADPAMPEAAMPEPTVADPAVPGPAVPGPAAPVDSERADSDWGDSGWPDSGPAPVGWPGTDPAGTDPAGTGPAGTGPAGTDPVGTGWADTAGTENGSGPTGPGRTGRDTANRDRGEAGS